MDLRPRQRLSFVGFTFTESEVQKMEILLNTLKEETMKDNFCKNLARVFNRSSGRAGKPIAKWHEIQTWFRNSLENGLFREPSLGAAQNVQTSTHHFTQNKGTMSEEDEELSTLEFEAQSSKDGAWYDVDTFRAHRFLDSGEIEFLVRYVGFSAEEDEWVNARDSLRKRSIALDRSECNEVNVGDQVVCFRDKEDQARYYDASVIEVERKWHDIRGCRCLFLIKYNHDNTEERVRLRRLCRRA